MVLYVRWFHGLLLAGLVSSSLAFDVKHAVNILPQPPAVEIGTNFTATCNLVNTSEATADDLVWYFPSKIEIPREQYTKINMSAVNVTIAITSETPSWLYCECKNSPVGPPDSRSLYGIILHKGYPPGKPENLSCLAVQVDNEISANITCFWDNGTPDTGEIETKTSLFFTYLNDEIRKEQIQYANKKHGEVTLDVFPHHVMVKVWVESENRLGKVQSDVLFTEADRFVRTSPPPNVKAISEKRFPTSLFLNWTLPIPKAYVRVVYQIRFRPSGSHTWTEVPLADTAKEILSFRLQYLRPDTLYVAQVRCKIYREGFGYWSDWSNEAATRTPEDKPMSKPDLWRTIYNNEGGKKQMVHILCKDPVLSNGKIRSFDIKMQGRGWEKVVVNSSELPQNSKGRYPIELRQVEHTGRIIYVEVIAHNSVGPSPKASLKILRNLQEFPPVNQLKWLSREGQLWVEWQPPNVSAGGSLPKHNLSEYVVEYVSVSDGQMDWQRVPGNSARTFISDLKNLTLYHISVYPLYSSWVGQPVTVPAYLEQGAPLEGPVVNVEHLGSHDAVVSWNEIPQPKQQGFILSHTLSYYTLNGSDMHVIPLPADIYSYHLKNLSTDTKYRVKIKASTIRGSATGPEHVFNTAKYGPGIVVGVCLGFLFFILFTMLLCIYKKELIQNKFCPAIPNPGDSGIRAWSPNYQLKDDQVPRESTFASVSVVQVDLLDGITAAFQEDKSGLPLKKDKYLSEEHSSGIGDSSCTSSPRQSVSDSDEGGDAADAAAASAVQYSSVVASQGYKGQTPAAPPPYFSRSESTQPLLESEEGGDAPGVGGQSHLLSPGGAYRSSVPGRGGGAYEEEEEEEGGRGAAGEQDSVLLRFWPLDAARQQSGASEQTDSPGFLEAAAQRMTKLDGYRPQ